MKQKSEINNKATILNFHFLRATNNVENSSDEFSDLENIPAAVKNLQIIFVYMPSYKYFLFLSQHLEFLVLA